MGFARGGYRDLVGSLLRRTLKEYETFSRSLIVCCWRKNALTSGSPLGYEVRALGAKLLIGRDLSLDPER
jgi:hypothetical protein